MNEVFRSNRSKIFSEDFDLDARSVLSEVEMEKLSEIRKGLKHLHSYHLTAKLNGKTVGWSFGIQKGSEEYYMINSAVLPEFRNQGIYTRMMSKVVEHLTELGYQKIYSRHKFSNNAILIAKLKFGFVITGFEVTDVFGNLVELSYYTNPKRRELLEFRLGRRKPDDELKKLIRK